LLSLFVSFEITLEIGAIRDFIHAHVDDSRSGPHEIAGNHAGAADGSHQNVGSAANARQIPGFRVTNRHRGIGIEQEHGHALSDDVAAAHYHGILTSDRDI